MDQATSHTLYLNTFIEEDGVCYDSATLQLSEHANRKVAGDNDPVKTHHEVGMEIFGHNMKTVLDRVDKVTVFNSFLSLLEHLDSYGSSGYDLTTPILLFLTLYHSEGSQKQQDFDNLIQDYTTQLSANFCNLPLLVVVLTDSPVLPILSTHIPLDVVPLRLSSAVLSRLSMKVSFLKDGLQTRVSRMKNWLGFGITTHGLTECLFWGNGKTSKKNYTKYKSLGSFPAMQRQKATQAVGQWDFHAHELSYDELLLSTIIIFDHVLTKTHLPLEDFHIAQADLISFLAAVRDTYHPGNPYHNFRHAVDVLQATFYFLIQIKVIPPLSNELSYSTEEFKRARLGSNEDKMNFASFLKPTDALVLLIAAIGHDVGHPGVTNGFLVAYKAPITKIYNDKSVLESFHSAVFNKLLQAYWPQTQVKEFRELIIDSVLATDMAMHFEYMRQIADFTQTEQAVGKGKDEDKPQNALKTSNKDITGLLCSIIIKCADISNVVRPLDISAEWGIVLAREFSDIMALEIDLGFRNPPTDEPAKKDACVKNEREIDGPGKKAIDPLELAKGQLFFIGTFARPLFEAVIKVLPQLSFTLDVLDDNKAYWTKQVSLNE
ncbi:HD-domain/PDEase-like protein [Nadsonia fulvescens var. elongata DSM 6958]|uniref:Phosphodiesterase n=1 Tax=Nadsonia fulvescens var. elongata DSM 6958 TaxID=857566 RepID=A0A1E3PHN0_9ASCO|nr:HD-domain/PDEase-like protein [Nadsonia fulvescens var. elongata DSM 6958]